MALIASRWPGLVVNEDRIVADEGGLEDAYERDTYGIRQLERVEYALDIGAHVGGATALLHELFPAAQIVAVEACPENIPALQANVGAFATVVHGAVTYEPGDVVLASTVHEGCRTSGSSIVTTRATWDAGSVPWTWVSSDYHLDERPLRKLTIEELMTLHGMPRVDFLKLDCEGSEISILRRCRCLDAIGIIGGEYHDAAAFRDAVRDVTGSVTCREGHLFEIRSKP